MGKGFKEKEFNWWLAFCFDGSKGIESIKIVNKLSVKEPDFTYCEKLYFNDKYDGKAPKPSGWDENRKNQTEKISENSEKKVKTPAFIELEVDEENNIRKINK